MTRLTDEELVRRVANVEAEPFAEFYDRHSKAAYSLARYMLGPTGAEDVVQEAFLSLWRSAPRYDPSRGAARTWLLAMVRNRGIDSLRHRSAGERRRTAMEALEDRIAVPHATPDDVIGDITRHEHATQVRAALAALPAEQRRVLELAYFGGWSQAEIAEYVEVPLGTIKGRARLGLEKLRDALGAVAPLANDP